MRTLHYLLLSLFIIGVSSCKTDVPSSANTINIRLKKDPDRLNPLLFPNPIAREVYQYIHLPLADYDPASLQLIPILIRQIPREIPIDTGQYKGGVAFDIELLPEAKWENGSPITAEDYLFTMKAINLPLTDAGKYREVTRHISDIIIDPTNNRKFRVIFAQDYMLALETCITVEIYPRYVYDSLNVLSSYDFKTFNETVYGQLKTDSVLVHFAQTFNSAQFSREKISGAGPYNFVSWTADQSIVLEKKKDYWGHTSTNPYLQQGPDKMIFHIIPDEVSAIALLKSGQLDVINEVSADAYETLEHDPITKDQFNFFHPELIKQYYILLNNGDPILKDVHVRKALAHIMDVDNIIMTLEHGKGIRTNGPIHPLKRTYNADLPPVTYDISEAKRLLDEAEWQDTDNDGIRDKVMNGKRHPLEFEVLISGQELGRKLSILMQESAAKAGIKIKITEKDFKLIRAEHIKTRKFQMIPSVLSQDLQTWDDMTKWHSSSDGPNGSNEMSYHNAATDALIDQIPTVKDDSARVALYKQIQQYIYDDQAAIFLYAPEERIIISKKWEGKATAKRPGYLANTFKYVGVSVTN